MFYPPVLKQSFIIIIWLAAWTAFQIGLVQNTGSPSLTYVTATLVILPLIANFERTSILRPMHNPNAE
jgi:uncharacterized membrane protein